MWARACLVLLAGLLTQILSVAPALADTASDARSLYCTREENRRPLVDIAVRLELGRHGRDGRLATSAGELTVDEWRKQPGGQFDRACATLIETRRLPKAAAAGFWSDLGGAVTGLVPVVTGALLGLGGTLLIGRRTARQQLSTELFDAASAYYHAGNDCLEAWEANSNAHAAQEAMAPSFKRVLAVLRRDRQRHPQWEIINHSDKRIRDLDRDIKRNRNEEIESSRQELDDIYEKLLLIAAALERPVHYYRAVRKP
jgi:hypothetical protein